MKKEAPHWEGWQVGLAPRALPVLQMSKHICSECGDEYEVVFFDAGKCDRCFGKVQVVEPARRVK